MNTQKIISILFGILSIYLITEFLVDKSDKRLRSFDKTYILKEDLIISDKFKTDFKSSYGIRLDLLNGNYKGLADTIFPLEIDLKILKNGKEIELFGDYKKSYFINNNEAQLTSFMSKKNAEYEIEMNIHDAEIERNTKELKLYIETNVPAPGYELYFDREFKWVYQIITGIVILISLITGYFGFLKKASS